MLPLAKDLKVLCSLEAGDETPEHGEEVGAEAGAAGDAPQRHRRIYPHLKSVQRRCGSVDSLVRLTPD